MLTRHLLYLGLDGLVCLTWRWGRPIAEQHFSHDEAGQEAAVRYLADWPGIAARIVVDLPEEDFRTETIPHLRGSDRRTVTARRLAQHYRATPWRMAIPQGREAEGRRDDVLLCTAITQPALLEAWIEVLTRAGTPLLGVHPAALMGEALVQRLRLNAPQLLVVVPAGLQAVRMSLFQQGRLKFSRIAEPGPLAQSGTLPRLREETRKTLQYVASQPWFLRQQPVPVLVLAEPALAGQITRDWRPEDSLVEVLTPAEVTTRLRLRRTSAGSTALLLALLVERPPALQLAPPEALREGRAWRLRTALYGLAGAVLLAALVGTASSVGHALATRRERTDLLAQLAATRAEVARLEAAQPPTTVAPERMSSTVRFASTEVARVPGIAQLTVPLSQILLDLPAIQPTGLSWRVTAVPPPDSAGSSLALRDGPGAGPAVHASTASSLTPHPFWTEARLQASLPGLEASPAAALALVDQLVARLTAAGWKVQVLRAPFDTDPRHAASGDALDPAHAAGGVLLRLVRRSTP